MAKESEESNNPNKDASSWSIVRLCSSLTGFTPVLFKASENELHL